MQGKYQLCWVQRNRGKTSRLAGAGVLVHQLAERVQAVGVGPASEVAERLTRLVDVAFCRHCRVAAVGNGRLLIYVDTAELVYAVRVRWAETLRKALPGLCRGRSVHRIVFEFGTAGVRVGGSCGAG